MSVNHTNPKTSIDEFENLYKRVWVAHLCLSALGFKNCDVFVCHPILTEPDGEKRTYFTVALVVQGKQCLFPMGAIPTDHGPRCLEIWENFVNIASKMDRTPLADEMNLGYALQMSLGLAEAGILPPKPTGVNAPGGTA